MPDSKKATEIHVMAANLARRAAVEELVGRTSRSFVGIGVHELGPTIVSALSCVGRFVSADRSYVFLYDRDSGNMSNTHEWCSEGVEPQKDMLQDLSMSVFSYAVKFLDSNPIWDVPLVEELPPEAQAEKDILGEQDIQSLVLVALTNRASQTIGFIGFDAVREIRPWQDEDVFLLEVLGGIIVAALEHQQATAFVAENEARQRAIINAIPDLLFTIDESGIIQGFRAPRKTKLAVSADMVEGASVWDVLDEYWHPRILEAIEKASKVGKVGEFEYELMIDGKVAWFEGRMTQQQDGEYLALVRDVTNRYESERALRRLALKLCVAEEKNRRELALQLHDGVSQDLTGIQYYLESLVAQGEWSAEDLYTAIKNLQIALRRTQDLTFDLSPPILYELGLAQALEALIRRFNAQEDIEFFLKTDKVPQKLDSSVGILLYRIACELLTNVVRHSGANRAELVFGHSKDGHYLSVTDNGQGAAKDTLFSASKRTRGGFGLFSIWQRIEPLGGQLSFSSEDGLCAVITIPNSTRDQLSASEGQA